VSPGIWRGIVEQLMEHGANVVIADLNEEKGRGVLPYSESGEPEEQSVVYQSRCFKKPIRLKTWFTKPCSVWRSGCVYQQCRNTPEQAVWTDDTETFRR